MENEIYVSEKAYNEYLKSINAVKENMERVESLREYVSDRMGLDEFTKQSFLENLKSEGTSLSEELEEKMTRLERIVINPEKENSEDIVGLGDTVILLINGHTFDVKVSTNSSNDCSATIVTDTSSIIGRRIYLRTVGDTIFYSTNGYTNAITILSKLKEQKLEL